MKSERPPLYLTLPFYLYGFAFGVGTNLATVWYYPIRGVGLLDIIFVLHFGFLFLTNSKTYTVRRLDRASAHLAFLIFVFVLWLFLSTLANAFTSDIDVLSVFAILRLLYFVLLIAFTSKHVSRFGYIGLLFGYVLGVATIFYQDFSNVSDENSIIFSIPVLNNPNVVGVALGLAVYFCSLGVMAGKQKLFLPLAFILAAASITTFSKAAWLLVLLGLLSNLLALHLQQDATGEARRRTQAMRYVVPLVAVISFVFYLYGELIVSLVDFKIESTKDIGSVETRANLLLAGAYAVLDHPLLGLGFGNYYKVEGLYSQIELPPLSREDNAHNVFAQVAATAGLPALILLVAIILFTFWHFRKMLQIKIHGSRYVKSLYLLISVSIFVLFGSVQLQLIAQPAFWFFSAIILGMCQSLNVGKSKRSFSRP